MAWVFASGWTGIHRFKRQSVERAVSSSSDAIGLHEVVDGLLNVTIELELNYG
jgi:hypothetical protein